MANEAVVMLEEAVIAVKTARERLREMRDITGRMLQHANSQRTALYELQQYIRIHGTVVYHQP